MKMQRPKVRFKGFTDDWEQRKFGELVEKYEDIVDTPTEGYTRLGIRSHAKGTFHSYVEKGKELETAKMFRVAANNFIVNITFGWEHAVAITDENDAGKLVSHRFPQYSFNEGKLPEFFKYLILDERFRHHLELSSPGGAGRNRVLKLNDMLDYKMSFPRTAEQEKVGMYFSHLDYIITFHQRKCEQTKKLKKYMLQKMFPKEGQTVPEIRFEGFTDAWEKHKFSDVIEIGSGMDYKHLEEGNVPVYGTGGYMLSVDKALSDDKDAIGIGRKGTIDKPYILRAPFWTVDTLFYCIPKEDYDLDFTSCLFQNVNWKKKDESTGVPSLSKVIINNVETITPIFDEQKKIGNYFQNLDHLITLHQRKCDELQNIKKFMLQNMFI
jgi:type I restriction enzyme S subunit